MTLRRKEEFWCSTACRKYFKTYLRTNMNGQYTIQCPNPSCNHHHHRVIKDGLITDDRCNDNSIHKDVLIGLAATLSDIPNHQSPENRRSRMGVV